MLGSFLTGTATRLFSISLPTIAQSLQTDISGISWALISYQLSTISLSLVFGRIGDLYGRQRAFGAGLLIFTVSSFICGLAQNIVQLVLFRLLQGVGGAMIAAQGRALAMEAVPRESAGRAQGFMTTAHHSGFLLGPSLGGFIIDYIHWRGIFFFLVPLGVAGAFLTWINKRRSASWKVRHEVAPDSSIDYYGSGLLVITTVVLIGILDRRIVETLTGGWQALLGATFVGFFVSFLVREATVASPLLELSLFRIRMFTFSTVSLLLVTITHSVTVFLLPFYLQEILNLSPSFMGILFMSAPLFSVTLSPLGGNIADKVGPRLPATAGVVLFGIASVLGTMLRTDSAWWLPTLMLALEGLASALFFPPNHTAMIGSVPREHRGVATGSLYMMFGLGNIFGISLGSFLMTAAFRFHTGLLDAAPTTSNPAAFATALNYTFAASLGISLVAVACSVLRGRG